MHHQLWAKIIKLISIAVVTCALSACEDSQTIHLPHLLDYSEVPQETLQQPRLVSDPPFSDSAEKSAPLLGSVPEKPNDFTPQKVSEHTRDELDRERLEGQKIHNEYYPTMTK